MQPPSAHWRSRARARRAFVEKIVDFAGRFHIDSRHMFQIGDGGALDRLKRAEVPQERALAGGADAGDFLQPGFADVLLALLPVRADRKAVRFIAQPRRNRAPDRAGAAGTARALA